MTEINKIVSGPYRLTIGNLTLTAQTIGGIVEADNLTFDAAPLWDIEVGRGGWTLSLKIGQSKVEMGCEYQLSNTPVLIGITNRRAFTSWNVYPNLIINNSSMVYNDRADSDMVLTVNETGGLYIAPPISKNSKSPDPRQTVTFGAGLVV